MSKVIITGNIKNSIDDLNHAGVKGMKWRKGTTAKEYIDTLKKEHNWKKKKKEREANINKIKETISKPEESVSSIINDIKLKREWKKKEVKKQERYDKLKEVINEIKKTFKS